MSSKFHLRMRGGNIFASTAPSGTSITGVALEVTIWNTGEPSAAVDWVLSVVLRDRPPITVYPTKIPEVITLKGEQGNPFIYGNESLIAKLGSADVTRTPVTGILLFYVYVEQTVFLSAGTVLNLSVTDIHDQKFHREQKLDEWPRG